jgi:hypothetical protein
MRILLARFFNYSLPMRPRALIVLLLWVGIVADLISGHAQTVGGLFIEYGLLGVSLWLILSKFYLLGKTAWIVCFVGLGLPIDFLMTQTSFEFSLFYPPCYLALGLTLGLAGLLLGFFDDFFKGLDQSLQRYFPDPSKPKISEPREVSDALDRRSF